MPLQPKQMSVGSTVGRLPQITASPRTVCPCLPGWRPGPGRRIARRLTWYYPCASADWPYSMPHDVYHFLVVRPPPPPTLLYFGRHLLVLMSLSC